MTHTDPVFIVDDLDQAAVLGLARRWGYRSLWLMGLRCLLFQLLLQPTKKKKHKLLNIFKEKTIFSPCFPASQTVLHLQE